jgi:DNA-binding MarR family transcriptional regulator
MPTSTGSTTQAREAYRNLLRATERLSSEFTALLRDHGMSPAQYNVMRVLASAPPQGAPCQYIGTHLLTKVPDVTRLIDRMEASELVRRARSEKDRRIVLVNLTSKGLGVYKRLEAPVEALHGAQLAHLSEQEIQALNQSLLRVLQPLAGEQPASNKKS